MSFELFFWVLMLLWILYGFGWNLNPAALGSWGWFPNSLFMWILFALLGWKVYGPMLHG